MLVPKAFRIIKLSKIVAIALLAVLVLLASISILLTRLLPLIVKPPENSLPTYTPEYPVPHVTMYDAIAIPPNTLTVYVMNTGNDDGIIGGIRLRYKGETYSINISNVKISSPLKIVNNTIIVPKWAQGFISIKTNFNFTVGDAIIILMYFKKNDVFMARREILVTKPQA